MKKNMEVRVFLKSDKINEWHYAEGVEMVLGSDSGQHENLRRADGSGRDDDLVARSDDVRALVLPVLDAVGPHGRVVDQHSLDEGVRQNGQLAARLGLLQVSGVRAAPSAVLRRHLRRRETFFCQSTQRTQF